ncbi:MAG: enoyl-CoA hydratase, partial [Rhodospirillales bacterium]|nr:enoyl-CoA hydratase [Rhodospirillales bacterium]
MATINISLDERPEGVVATVVLDRPEKLNAMSSPMVEQLRVAAADLRSRENLRCVIITGVNDKAFCAGSDLKELSELTSGSAGGFLRKTHDTLQAIRDIPVPVIARIQGPCMGVGMEIAAACDFRLAATGSLYAMPKVKIGLPSVIEAALVARIVGSGRASWLMMTGDNISAQKAYEWGFLEDVADDTAGLDDAVQSAVKGI